MTNVILAIFMVVMIPILVVVIGLLLSNLGAYWTKIAQGTTVFISVGDSLKAIWPNVGGYKMFPVEDLDGRRWLIPESDEEKQLTEFFRGSRVFLKLQKWVWKTFGIRFISFYWPHVHVHKFDIRKGGRRRIEARSEVKEDAPLKSRVVDSEEDTVVDSLLFLAPRPVYIEGVELAGDNSRVNLLLLPVFRQVIPELPAYYLKGDFFTLLDAAIEAAVVDFFARHCVAVEKETGQFAADSYEDLKNDEKLSEKKKEEYSSSFLTYSHWLRLTKSGEGSPLEKSLRHLNVSSEYLERLEKCGEKYRDLVSYIKNLTPSNGDRGKTDDVASPTDRMIPNGIVPRFGFALISFRIVEWEVHSSTKALAESLLAKETMFHTAEGIREKAKGERDAKLAVAEGESGRFEQLVKALVANNVDPNVAARVMETQLRTENVRDSKLTTYVEGGGTNTSVMVPASSTTPK